MIKVLVAYDNEDERLGNYFDSCKLDVCATISSEESSEIDFELIEIASRQCNRAFLDLLPKQVKKNPFLLIVYAHGNEEAIRVNGTSFIRIGEDNEMFKDTVIYSTACLTGKLLGKELVGNGCKAFIGYDGQIVAFKDTRQDISIKCDNLGITMFLTSDITISEAFDQMKKYYTQESQKLLSFNDILASGLLINARESLVFHGNPDITRNDLVYH